MSAQTMLANGQIKIPVAPTVRTNFRAGALPRTISTPVDRASLCPDNLKGFCRATTHCPKGTHGLRLIADEEVELAAQRDTFRGRLNRLKNVHRTIGLGDKDDQYHSDPPGVGSPLGIRHDNDYADVKSIRILPTTDEILSLRVPHLPLKDEGNKTSWGTREGRFKNHCAIQFRHLRYECTEPIIDCVYLALQHLVVGRMRHIPTDYSYHRTTHKGVGFNYFHGVDFEDISFQEHDGIQVRCSFSCPIALRGDALRLSNVLEKGMLCAIIAVNVQTDELYTVFCETITRHSTQGMAYKTGDASRASVIVKLAENDNVAKARELVWMANRAPASIRYALVDITNVLPTSFVNHLNRLKALTQDGADVLPFIRSFSAHADSDESILAVSAPQYSLADGFQWKLDGLKGKPDDNIAFVLNTSDKDEALSQLSTRTTLDVGQAGALYDNLTRELAFTQGPPGTGKSFLGISTVKVLVDSVTVKQRGPIIVVAQTNHALDEILEGLQAKGIESIARLGSRSKSTKLEKCLLRNLREQRRETCQENSRRMDARRRAERLEKDGTTFCEAMGEMNRILNQFRDLAVNPWQNATSDETGKSTVKDTSSAIGADVSDESSSGKDRPADRRRKEDKSRREQIRTLIKSLSEPEQCEMLVELHKRHHAARCAVADARRLRNLHILEEKDVVGMTTSACAREVELIKQLNPRILVIEEASEVLEAHTICALVPSVQHCINIGDPLQLRPHITARVLDTEHNDKYCLNEPLFERLIKAGLPYAKLSVQRRAHPELSTLIQVTDYPYVVNHASTSERAPVPGMASRLQWCYHNQTEKLVTPAEGLVTESWANEYEAEMAVHFAAKFVKGHGYGPGDVAIITPYNGQLAMITKLLAKKQIKVDVSKEDRDALVSGGYLSRDDLGPHQNSNSVDMADMLRVATLDNFQGEEAKIVILCTVRSNQQNKIGFLKTSNRINVAVSRAKEGFFVIGNAELLRRNSPHWAKIVAQFDRQRGLHKGFQVTCRYHPRQKILVSSVWAAEQASDWIANGCDLCMKW